MAAITIAAIRARLRRQAERCLNLEDTNNRCECGGRLRGMPHGEEWFKRTAERLSNEAHQDYAGGPLFGPLPARRSS